MAVGQIALCTSDPNHITRPRMTPFMSLLLPIVLSAVAVFIRSMSVHIAMPWHKRDYGNVPNHDAATAGIQWLNLARDDDAVPTVRLPAARKYSEYLSGSRPRA